MKVLVIGGTGMLGMTLSRRLSGVFELHATARTPANLTPRIHWHAGVDVLNFSQVQKVLEQVQPQVVINCVGLIRQLPEGQKPIPCLEINSLFPHRLYEASQKLGARVVHVSTDCVFSGHKGSAYLESDFADADDVYGRTKYLGELKGPGSITLRTSIIGHELRNKLSLVEWFLSQKNQVRGYTEAIYSGLPTVEMADLIEKVVIPNPSLEGLYHVSSNPISKYELIKLISEIYGHKIAIEPFGGVKENKTLDSSRFRQVTGWQPLPWKDLIQKMHQDYLELKRAER